MPVPVLTTHSVGERALTDGYSGAGDVEDDEADEMGVGRSTSLV